MRCKPTLALLLRVLLQGVILACVLLPGVLILAGCAANSPRQDAAQAENAPLPRVLVAATELQIAEAPPSDAQVLDVGLVIFDPGLPEDENRGRELGVFPEIRNAEARFLPFALREVLVESQHWGVVRVLPNADESTELLVQGTILHSDGARLKLEIQARDPSGRTWLHQIYRADSAAVAVEARDILQEQPFRHLYSRIANDLLQQRLQLTASQLRQIDELGFLRYASSLAPEAFADYLRPTADGHYTYQRLPSAEDPMVQRIEKVREQEHLFIDTVDDQYFELYSEMAPTYKLWRQYNREQVLYQEAKETRIKEREAPRKGTFMAMKDSYNRYRWAKLQQQELGEIAEGFDNEIAPTAVELEGQVVKLEGSLDQRYHDWRRILRKIYELEVGAGPDE